MVSLVVPGSSERMLQKATGIDAEEIVIDLEDAVIPERKAEALTMTLAALSQNAPPFTAPKVSVRVNAIGSQWCHLELMALAANRGRLDSIVVPKVESAGDMEFIDRLLDGVEADPASNAAPDEPLEVQALIETADGVANAREIAVASWRMSHLILGYADLSVSLGRTARGRDDLDRWLAIQDTLLVAARSSGLEMIDGPHLVIDDVEGLNRAAARAADLGFDGKWAIHPSHIEPIRTAFRPSDAELQRAKDVQAALAEAAAAGDGAVQLNGQMLDEPVRLMAERTLKRAGIA